MADAEAFLSAFSSQAIEAKLISSQSDRAAREAKKVDQGRG